MKIGIIDYGVGNLGSVMRAIEALHVTPVLVDSAIDMHTVDRLISNPADADTAAACAPRPRALLPALFFVFMEQWHQYR